MSSEAASGSANSWSMRSVIWALQWMRPLPPPSPKERELKRSVWMLRARMTRSRMADEGSPGCICESWAKGTTTKGENGMISEVQDEDYDIYEVVKRAADFDANQNGIADWYETATGKTDAQADPDGDGYTNLEDYLNYMATPNQITAAGETVTFDLADYFAGISGATYVVKGKGTIDGTTLKVATDAADKGFLKAQVTATKGDVKVTREFNVYLSGTVSGINLATNGKARVESYELYNAAGVQVAQGNANGAAVDRLPLKGHIAGVYILKVKDTDGRNRSYSVVIR